MISTPRARPLREIDFDHLLSHEGRPSVSIFIGNDQPWPGNRRSMLALKAQAKKVREQLSDYGVGKSEVDELLKPLGPWLEEGERWQSVAHSLAIYLSAKDFKVYEVDLVLMDSAHVGSVYDVRPLLPLRGIREFYLLALSQAKVELIRVEPGHHAVVEVEGMPQDFNTQSTQAQRSLQARTFQASGSQNALFHGHGQPKDHRKAQLSQFAREVAQRVQSYLTGKANPLIVVALSPLGPMFMESLNYPHVQFVYERDPLSESQTDLVAHARREYIEWSLAQSERLTENVLAHHISRPQGESRVAEIVKKAQQGQVSKLLIRQQDYVWGRFKPQDQEAEVVRAHLPGTEDLLNRAAIYTLQNGGEVYLFDSLKFQAPEHAVAVLRNP